MCWKPPCLFYYHGRKTALHSEHCLQTSASMVQCVLLIFWSGKTWTFSIPALRFFDIKAWNFFPPEWAQVQWWAPRQTEVEKLMNLLRTHQNYRLHRWKSSPLITKGKAVQFFFRKLRLVKGGVIKRNPPKNRNKNIILEVSNSSFTNEPQPFFMLIIFFLCLSQLPSVLHCDCCPACTSSDAVTRVGDSGWIISKGIMWKTSLHVLNNKKKKPSNGKVKQPILHRSAVIVLMFWDSLVGNEQLDPLIPLAHLQCSASQTLLSSALYNM